MTGSLTRRLASGIAVSLALGAALSAISPPTIKFTDTKLSNGLRLIVAEDHVAPVFSIAVVYNVGSRDERKGRTGFAHLFEHMMFKGSENVGPGEHFYTVFSNGGNMNGTTNKERTLYFETMPANQLEAAMFLEADRMRVLAIVKDNLDNQRNAVQEERRQGDGQPAVRQDERIDRRAGLRQPGLQAFGDRVDGRSHRRLDAGCGRVLPDLLRPEQRDRRGHGRRHGRPRPRAGAQVLRVDSGAAAATRGGRHAGAAER